MSLKSTEKEEEKELELLRKGVSKAKKNKEKR
jgi:hypothetical protein